MDIIGVGESGVDIMFSVTYMPKKDEKVRAKEIGRFPGGMIGNFCSAASKLGAKCGIVSAIGNDVNGNLLLKDYKESGVDSSRIYIEKDGITFYCIVFLDQSGEKYLMTIDTPLSVPPENKIDFAYLKTSKFVHLNSMNKRLVEAVIKGLEGSDTKISLDYEAHAQKPGLDSWKEIFQKVSILFMNKDGAKTLYDEPEEELGKICNYGPELVIMTCGNKGGIIYDKSKMERYSAFQVKKIVDTTGAGDCFNAAFLTEYIRTNSVREAAEYAAAAAAISIGKAGARSGQPSDETVRKFLEVRKKGET